MGTIFSVFNVPKLLNGLIGTRLEVNPNVLQRWKREQRDYGSKAFTGNGKSRAEENHVAELERKVGRQALEIDFLRRCLQHVEEQRKLQALTTRSSSTRTSKRK